MTDQLQRIEDTSSALTRPEVVEALQAFEKHPRHPDSIQVGESMRVPASLLFISGLCVLAAGLSWALAPTWFLEHWSSFAAGVSFPWFAQWLGWRKSTRMKRQSQLVFDVDPDYAMARIVAYHQKQDAEKVERSQHVSTLRRIASGVNRGVVVSVLLVSLIVMNLAVDVSMLLMWASSLVSMVCMALLMIWSRYHKGPLEMRMIQQEREHLKTIAPELFKKDQLIGAISVPHDDPDTKGALSQSNR